MGNDYKNDPEWRRFENHVRTKLVPKMAESQAVMVITPDFGAFDVDFALQIGASVLLEKPLLVVVPEGRTLPPKLERIADRIVPADLSNPESLARDLKKFFADYAKQ